MIRIADPRLRALAKVAIASGWQIRPTGSGHLQLYREGHESITFSKASLSDRRAWLNVRAKAKRAGIPVP